MYEKLSALIDNELDGLERARLLRELGRDDTLAERWSRYHVIGLAMRREQIMPARDLPERVTRALETLGGSAGETRVSAGRKPRFQSTGRFAVAASIAGVLVVGGLIVKLYDANRAVGTSMPSAQQLAVNNDGMRWEGVNAKSEDALNTFLIEHGEFTSASGMNGLTAYTKFVAYDSR